MSSFHDPTSDEARSPYLSDEIFVADELETGLATTQSPYQSAFEATEDDDELLTHAHEEAFSDEAFEDEFEDEFDDEVDLEAYEGEFDYHLSEPHEHEMSAYELEEEFDDEAAHDHETFDFEGSESELEGEFDAEFDQEFDEEFADELEDEIEDEGPWYTAGLNLFKFTPKLRWRVAMTAQRAWEDWDKGARRETERQMRNRLRDYWRAAGVNTRQIEGQIDERRAWSAAFISWVMQEAGAGSDFTYSPSHQRYIAAAKENRENNRTDNPFWAYRLSEVTPEVGDLVCTCRMNSGATYDNIDEGFRATHCDVVTEVKPGSVTMIGGNVNDSVGQKTLRTDSQGRVRPRGSCSYFAIIKVRDVDTKTSQSTSQPSPGPSLDIARAVRLNRLYGRRLGWSQQADLIARHLGLSNAADASAFAQAVASWQAKQGMSARDRDGIVGPSTWARLRPMLDLSSGSRPTSDRPSAGDRPDAPFGTLTLDTPGRTPFRYTFTANDALWVARMLVGEAGGRDNAENRAVLWSMFNRYALFTHRHYRTFAAFIRAYSTPIQPVFRNRGSARSHMNSPGFMRTGGTYKRKLNNGTYVDTGIPKGQLKRHLELQQTPWRDLSSSARSLAELALKGQIANPGIGNASEFASTRIYYRRAHGGQEPTDAQWRTFTEGFAKRKKWRWVGDVPGLDQKKNAFFTPNSLATLPEDAIRIVPAS